MNIGLITYPIEKSPAGVGTHTYNLVKHILEADSKNTYFLLHYQGNDDPIYCQREILYRRIPLLPVMFSDSCYLWRNSSKFDIVHRFSPGGFLFPIQSKKVVTVHDLYLYKRYPFNRQLETVLARTFNRKSIENADLILTVSDFTRSEVLDTFNVDPERVRTVYNGIGSAAFETPMTQEEWLETYKLESPYILFVSTIEPRKNLIGLVQAFEILKDKHGIQEQLVVVGRKGWDYRETLEYIETSRHRSAIRMAGFVPKSALVRFYRNASLFVYPSFMEGFGIPPLEAMYLGCPTLASNTSSLPEVMNYAEMMFDPHNVSEIADKCRLVLNDRNARLENIEKGRQNASRFSWRKSAEAMIDLYDQLALESAVSSGNCKVRR
jgi:glycosyltransferase involved in cell wall biosynthesis